MTLEKIWCNLKKAAVFCRVQYAQGGKDMNGKKIVLLTTLIVFVVLIGLLAIFTRFVLNIDFGGEIQQSNSSAQVEEEPSDVDQADESESDQQPDQSQDKEQDKTCLLYTSRCV